MFRFASLLACAAIAAFTPAVASAAPPTAQLVLAQRDRDRDGEWRGRGGGWRGPDSRGGRGFREGRRAPLQQVLRSIESRTPGRLLDASVQDRDGRQVYRVRWAGDDGRRLDYLVDAESGRILSAE